MFLKFNFSLITCFLVTMLLGSCGDDQQPSSLTSSARLVVGTSADNPPFEFNATTGNDQQIQGFDIDLMKEIATILNMPVEFIDTDFNGLIPALQSNRITIVASAMAPTQDRRNAVDFSEVYIRNAEAIIGKKDNDMTQEKFLTNKKIGVQLGSTFELTMQAIAKRIPNITIIVRNRLGDLIQELKAGRIDGILTEESVAHAYMKNNPDLNVSVLEGHSSESALAVVKNSPLKARIDEALKILADNGKLDALKIKWFTVQ